MALVPRPAPRRFGLRKRWVLPRHLLAGGVTVGIVMVVVLVVSVPFMGVFLLDEDVRLPEWAAAYAMGIAWWALLVTAGVLLVMPVAMAVERFTLLGGKVRVLLAVLLPFGLVAALVADGYVMIRYLLESPRLYDAGAVAFGLMLLLAIYWPLLWALNLAGYGVVRLYRRRLRGRAEPAGPAPATSG